MGASPKRLLGLAVLVCATAALFGSTPLADWVQASSAGGTVVQQATDAWQDFAHWLLLDRPYDALRRAIREAEASRFDQGE